MALKIDPLIFLPEENSLQLFSYLGLADLGNCCQVNRKWNRIATEDSLWKEKMDSILKMIFPINSDLDGLINPIARQLKLEITSSGMSFKEFMNKISVKTQTELFQRIQQFINQSSPDQKNSKFKTLFPFNPQYECEILLGKIEFHSRSYNESEMAFDVNKICIFMKRLPNVEIRHSSCGTSFNHKKGLFLRTIMELPMDIMKVRGRAIARKNS